MKQVNLNQIENQIGQIRLDGSRRNFLKGAVALAGVGGAAAVGFPSQMTTAA